MISIRSGLPFEITVPGPVQGIEIWILRLETSGVASRGELKSRFEVVSGAREIKDFGEQIGTVSPCKKFSSARHGNEVVCSYLLG